MVPVCDVRHHLHIVHKFIAVMVMIDSSGRDNLEHSEHLSVYCISGALVLTSRSDDRSRVNEASTNVENLENSELSQNFIITGKASNLWGKILKRSRKSGNSTNFGLPQCPGLQDAVSDSLFPWMFSMNERSTQNEVHKSQYQERLELNKDKE